MHKIHAKEFTRDDFSSEHVMCICDKETPVIYHPSGNTALAPIDVFDMTIMMLNRARDLYLQTKDKQYWWQMIQLLPSSYNQRRTVMLNYEVLRNIYHARKGHKLNEWREFCEWIETLPYSELITGDDESNSSTSGLKEAMERDEKRVRERIDDIEIKVDIDPDDLEKSFKHYLHQLPLYRN